MKTRQDDPGKGFRTVLGTYTCMLTIFIMIMIIIIIITASIIIIIILIQLSFFMCCTSQEERIEGCLPQQNSTTHDHSVLLRGRVMGIYECR